MLNIYICGPKRCFHFLLCTSIDLNFACFKSVVSFVQRVFSPFPSFRLSASVHNSITPSHIANVYIYSHSVLPYVLFFMMSPFFVAFHFHSVSPEAHFTTSKYATNIIKPVAESFIHFCRCFHFITFTVCTDFHFTLV